MEFKEEYSVSYSEFRKVKEKFTNISLDYDQLVMKKAPEEDKAWWSLSEGKPLFGNQVKVEGKSFICHYYVYPLAYSLIEFMEHMKNAEPLNPPKEKKYILTHTALSALESNLFKFKCQRAELSGDTELGYAERLVKYLYPEAWREGEGIYWDIIGDSIIKESCESGFYQEYKDE